MHHTLWQIPSEIHRDSLEFYNQSLNIGNLHMSVILFYSLLCVAGKTQLNLTSSCLLMQPDTSALTPGCGYPLVVHRPWDDLLFIILLRNNNLELSIRIDASWDTLCITCNQSLQVFLLSDCLITSMFFILGPHFGVLLDSSWAFVLINVFRTLCLLFSHTNRPLYA